MGTSAINRSFGVLAQWGLRRALTALRKPGALDELAEHGVPEVWRHSIAAARRHRRLDRQLGPLERELRPLARSDERAKLLMTIPGVWNFGKSRPVISACRREDYQAPTVRA